MLAGAFACRVWPSLSCLGAGTGRCQDQACLPSCWRRDFRGGYSGEGGRGRELTLGHLWVQGARVPTDSMPSPRQISQCRWWGEGSGERAACFVASLHRSWASASVRHGVVSARPPWSESGGGGQERAGATSARRGARGARWRARGSAGLGAYPAGLVWYYRDAHGRPVAALPQALFLDQISRPTLDTPSRL